MSGTSNPFAFSGPRQRFLDHQQAEDAKHLRWLAWGVYAYAALGTLYFLAFGAFFATFMFVLPKTKPATRGGDSDMLPFVFFAAVFGLVILFNIAMIGIQAYGARCIQQRKHYVFCVVTAALLCMGVPFGTVLGVFLLMVLNRPSVKLLFGQPTPYLLVPYDEFQNAAASSPPAESSNLAETTPDSSNEPPTGT